jgi:hypothetical protein
LAVVGELGDRGLTEIGLIGSAGSNPRLIDPTLATAVDHHAPIRRADG